MKHLIIICALLFSSYGYATSYVIWVGDGASSNGFNVELKEGAFTAVTKYKFVGKNFGTATVYAAKTGNQIVLNVQEGRHSTKASGVIGSTVSMEINNNEYPNDGVIHPGGSPATRHIVVSASPGKLQ